MLGLSEPLRDVVARKFTQARSSQEVIFSDTHLALLRQPRLPTLQLRFCPALGKKPTKDSHPESKGENQRKFDPFDNPSLELLVAAIPKVNVTHNLILNKYPVILNHFILATQENKPQTSLLEEEDLYLTYVCLQAWQQESVTNVKHSLFAFFNSGEHSGASQIHRHLQFLPVEDMENEVEKDWQVLCETMTSPAHESLPLLHNPDLSFVHFATRLQPSMSASDVHEKYMLLLKAAISAISDKKDLSSLDAIEVSQGGRTTFSYNLAMTARIMAILPRKKEASDVPGLADSSVAINGTILAGTMMVKAEDEWNSLRRQPKLVQHLLNNITYARKGCMSGIAENL